jgi:hypothetical protein
MWGGDLARAVARLGYRIVAIDPKAPDGAIFEPVSLEEFAGRGPLADRVAAALELHSQRSGYQADDDLVFCHPDIGRPLDRSKLLKRFKAALAAAGARAVTFHGLRHTFGTRMAAAGVPMRTLQEWMGHRDFKTTLRYADYAPSAHEAEQVNRAFAQAGINSGINLSTGRGNTDQVKPL